MPAPAPPLPLRLPPIRPLRAPRARRRAPRPLLGLALLSLLLAGCDDARRVIGERIEPRTPHERYAERLRQAGLADAPVGRLWLAASGRALREPVAVPLPYREVAYFGAAEPRAAGYRLELRRGDRLVAELRPSALGPGQLFVDLFRLEPGDSAGERTSHVASAEPEGPLRLDVEIEQDGAYVLRVQPEALHAVRYAITVRTGPSLGFPVQGRDDRAVRSFFGADRDGGRRSHQGIDIFAPRGTPVVAVGPGVVRRTGVTALGGNVVWVWDERRRQSVYYAHLDRSLVSDGQRVDAGDTLGLVGNTGNARTTPPHLHFGIYRRGQGAVDPYPFVRRSRGEPPEVAADTAPLGDWLRVAGRGAGLRPALEGGSAAPLPAGTALVLLGAAARSYRVALPDGREGWIAAGASEPAESPIGTVRADVVRERPTAPALAMDSLDAPRAFPVLARFGEARLVRAPGGQLGWASPGPSD